MLCQKKNKRLCVFCSFCLLLCLVVQCSVFCVPSYASETSSQTVSQYFSEHDFYDTCAFVCRKYASFPYMDYITGANSGITYDAWVNYLDSQDKSSLLDESVTITGSGGGRGYDIPQDVRQEMLNFVSEIYINNNPLSFTQAYIYSYNFLDPTVFPSYAMFASTKELCKQNSPKWILLHYYYTNSTLNRIYFIALDTGFDYGLVGTVTGGTFTNVNLYKNWATLGRLDQISNATKKTIMANGSVSDGLVSATGNYPTLQSLANTSSQPSSNTKTMLISSLENNELVYVFQTLNAYKNYNSGSGQQYYLPSNSQTIVPYYDGFTQSDLNSAGNFYNNIVINTSGDNPNDIRKKTDSILGSLDGILSDDDSSSTGILAGLADIITGATGAITPIKELINDDLKQFVGDIFDWLPASVVSLWIAGITFGVFFGVLKVIRG